MNRYFFIILILLLTGACTTSVQEKEIETPEEPEETVILFDSTGVVVDSVKIPYSQKDSYTVRLDCRNINTTGTENPRYEVALVALNQRISLDTVDVCNDFSNEDFATYEIPARAISACGGWHEGVGEYFYLTEDNQDLVVNYAWLKEEQTTNRYPYREVYRLKLPQLEQ